MWNYLSFLVKTVEQVPWDFKKSVVRLTLPACANTISTLKIKAINLKIKTKQKECDELNL